MVWAGNNLPERSTLSRVSFPSNCGIQEFKAVGEGSSTASDIEDDMDEELGEGSGETEYCS